MKRRDFIRSAATIPCAVAGVAMLPTPVEPVYNGVETFTFHERNAYSDAYRSGLLRIEWKTREEIRRMYR